MYENVFSFVRVDNDVVADSDEYEVSHGVREGSVLSPLLFTVFIDSVIEMLFSNDVSAQPLLPGIDPRALLFADDIALMAALLKDLQVLLDKACVHANKMNYQLSAKKSCYMIFGDSSWDDMDVNYIKLKTGHDKINTVSDAIEPVPLRNELSVAAKKSCYMIFGDSSWDDMDVNYIKLKTGHDKINTVSGAIEPVPLRRVDRFKYLGYMFHESLGGHPQAIELCEAKKKFLGRTFIDSDDSAGPRVIYRIESDDDNAENEDRLVAKTIPLKVFQKSKKNFFEEPVDFNDASLHIENYWANEELSEMIQDYIDTTGKSDVVGMQAYPEGAW
eukprot:CAMPEP_0197362376 /NCGR_PEP_ID=MMETSP0893-20130614/63973_1 /TAXON_ID=44058 ORGANISM="Aureoumbra lagunensis, Strain CCMP1510" /NCGR_SAMPLE_ID=MMETSP0893 /ASSEMBLY_ACC=CAM_ASM_000539 /LENGTH=330 /DNA_ID=CAMNT_0042884157 /DNA_START=1241 /DNA_END=2232 /DNA_ORIENTATION=-